jgi:hypothetical protein
MTAHMCKFSTFLVIATLKVDAFLYFYILNFCRLLALYVSFAIAAYFLTCRKLRRVASLLAAEYVR